MVTKRAVMDPVGADRRKGSDRRRGRSRVHLPERRLVFDRRSRPAGRIRSAYLDWVRRTSASPGRAALLMGSIVALSVADMAFTFRALGRGLEEVNPVMEGLLGAGHGVAALVKVGVSAGLAAAGWWFRRFRRVIEVALLVAALLLLVVCYHLLTYSVS